jgi:hypothetical protein
LYCLTDFDVSEAWVRVEMTHLSTRPVREEWHEGSFEVILLLIGCMLGIRELVKKLLRGFLEIYYTFV